MLLKTLSTLLLATAMSSASAVTVTSVGLANGGQELWGSAPSLGYSNTPVLAGTLRLGSPDAVGGSFLAYCVELTQNFPELPAVYTVGSFGDKEADLTKAVQWMVNNNTFTPHNAQEAALNQAIIWEVLYERSGQYGFNTGDIIISDTSLLPSGLSSLPTALGMFSFDFNQLTGLSPSVHISKLTNPNDQDLLVISPVPEPSTYALMLAGLGGIGYLARRRKTSR